MILWVFGLNYQIVLVELCECVVFVGEVLLCVLGLLCDILQIVEVVLLFICNCIELYVVVDLVQVLDQWLCSQVGDLQGYLYQYVDVEVVCYLFWVVIGLDLMVLGELQIFGQVKDVWLIVCDYGLFGQCLDCLFQQIFLVVKCVCIDIQIGINLVLVVLVVVCLVQNVFVWLDDFIVLLVGVGEIIELVVWYLSEGKVWWLLIVNCIFVYVQELVSCYGGVVLLLIELDCYLGEVDVVFLVIVVCELVIYCEMVVKVLCVCWYKLMLLFDLVVLCDIEVEVGMFNDVFFYIVDDLECVVEDNCCGCCEVVVEVEVIIDLQVLCYVEIQQVSVYQVFLWQLCVFGEVICVELLECVCQQLVNGKFVDEVLELLVYGLINCLLYLLIVVLCVVVLSGDVDLICVVECLFLVMLGYYYLFVRFDDVDFVL